MTELPWYKNAVLYQIHIRAFADGNGDGHGDFIGLTQKLDYLRDLGVDCLWLMPMYPSPLLDGGYDIADFYGIHPDYGTLDDFKAFLAAAHERGLKVIADLVLNHTSDQHPWFQAARQKNADGTFSSPYHDYYVWSDTDQKYQDARIIFIDTEKSNWAWDESAQQFFWHRFYSSQPDLNFDNPAVRAEMLNVLKFWLDMGLDGFRADAVPYLFEREGTMGENLPETHAYLKEMRRFIDSEYPQKDRILLAEANQWPVELRPYFGEGDEFHLAFNFPVMPRLYMALRQNDRTPVVSIMERTPPIPENCQWCTFLRNHDELTLEMVTDEERQWMWQEYAPDPRMRINLGIRRRLAPLLDGDRNKIELLYSVLFTLPGTPIIYYGDEIGMGDNIWLHDRDGVRTPLQWNAQANAGFSSAPTENLYAPVITNAPYNYQQVNVAAQQADPHSLWHTVQHFIAVRKAHPVFGRGSSEFLTSTNKAVLTLIRADADETVLALHNLSPESQTCELDLSRWQGAQVKELLVDQSFAGISSGPYNVSLKPYGTYWLKIQK